MRRLLCLLAALQVLGCSVSTPSSGVIRPEPGQRLDSIPGPLPTFGPYEKASDAIQAACPLLLSKPRATAGRPIGEHFALRWQLSQEYCAWLYYTPDHRYEMSMIAAGGVQGGTRKRTCGLPPVVVDARYPPASLGYVFVLHTHPYENILSDQDIRFIVDMAIEHGATAKTKTGEVPLSIVAFFSKSDDLEHPSCDGFFQYIPATGELMRWTQPRGVWSQELTGRVVWIDASLYRIDKP